MITVTNTRPEKIMGVTVAWDDEEQTVVRLTVSDTWSAEELRATGIKTILLLRSVPHPVYVITDFSASKHLPIGVFWQARELSQMRAPNWAAGIAITQDMLVKNLIDIFARIYLDNKERRSFVVRTNEEAYEIINALKKDSPVPR
jgi:hypothetical protein